MNYMRPLSNSVRPIALSDSQKDALAAAMREASENAQQSPSLRPLAAEPTPEYRLAATDELLFIL